MSVNITNFRDGRYERFHMAQRKLRNFFPDLRIQVR